jgi:hypothetical protein
MRSEILKAVIVKRNVFWDIIPCSLTKVSGRLDELPAYTFTVEQ